MKAEIDTATRDAAAAKRESAAEESAIRYDATKASTVNGQAGFTLALEPGELPGERPLAPPPSDGPSTVLALIERVALDPRADVEKLERMMAMYERLKAKEAELAFNAAKGRILKKLAGIKIVKNRSALHEIEKGNPKKAPMKPSNTPRWRRSTNICARSWRKRRWISPIPTNRGRTAAS